MVFAARKSEHWITEVVSIVSTFIKSPASTGGGGGNWFGIATGLEFDSQQGQEPLFFYKPALRTTRPLTKIVLRYDVEVKNTWRYTAMPQHIFRTGILLKHRDKLH
jgi:hypothetical protein